MRRGLITVAIYARGESAARVDVTHIVANDQHEATETAIRVLRSLAALPDRSLITQITDVQPFSDTELR